MRVDRTWTGKREQGGYAVCYSYRDRKMEEEARRKAFEEEERRRREERVKKVEKERVSEKDRELVRI